MPRDSAALYEAEDNVIKKERKNDLSIENSGNFGLKFLGILR